MMSLSFSILTSMDFSTSTLKRVFSRERNSCRSMVSSPLTSSKLKMSSTSSSVGVSAPIRSVSIFITLGNSLLVKRPFLSWSKVLNIFSSTMASNSSVLFPPIILLLQSQPLAHHINYFSPNPGKAELMISQPFQIISCVMEPQTSKASSDTRNSTTSSIADNQSQRERGDLYSSAQEAWPTRGYGAQYESPSKPTLEEVLQAERKMSKLHGKNFGRSLTLESWQGDQETWKVKALAILILLGLVLCGVMVYANSSLKSRKRGGKERRKR